MVMKAWVVVEKVRRIVRTVIFMVTMMASLAGLSLPLMVALGDIMFPFLLLSSFTCVTCHGFNEHFRLYAFKSSLIDFPLVSILRSIIITCVYSLCDGPTLSHGPYVGTVILCSFVSILLLSIKACVFTVNFGIEAETSSASQRLHWKKPWGMPVLFLSSVLFALGHTAIAYRTSCRARRKLLFHRVDPEAVSFSCLNCNFGVFLFQVFIILKTKGSFVQKCFFGLLEGSTISHSLCRENPKSDSEARRKPFGQSHDEGELPARLLVDIDSLFITLQGLTIHYKLSIPGSPPRSWSSTTFLGPKVSFTPVVAPGRLKLDSKVLSMSSKTHSLHLQRSYSNQFHSSSLYAPLLDDPLPSPVLSEDIPVFRLDDSDAQVETSNLNPGILKQDIEANGEFGIVLVHGFGGGVFSWRHVMEVLACQVGYSVAAFDRPGWGLSSRPSRMDWEGKELPNPYKLETQVDLLLSFCSEMRFSSVVLVGHDDGGLLALKAAQKVQTSMNSFNPLEALKQENIRAGCNNVFFTYSRSITIKAVVLLNVSLSREVVPAFARILLRTSLGKKHLVRSLLRTEITQVVNRRAWYDATKLTTEVLSFYKAPLCVEGWDEALHEIGRLSHETILSPQNATSLLKAIEEMPVLVVAGAEDAHISLKSSQAMASKLVNSRLVTISGCGHLPHEECPKALLAAISPFISRVLLKPE
ncbi:Alpha/beta-hydrolase domain-containing protein isoform 2 [Hibiscus syriacus]|uniref:Alpha/beta-hydrolase domain-containing protein isoform 2 n=1 Tax=Hibiscus syriacus TaxID=106335 RepID=A0A6A2XFD5_HIBSY|nr:Alpha/beta-hydrolase domain-containing protein isoform 2 [Hibiscus syriacus]